MASSAIRLVKDTDMDKSKALEAALTQIDRQFGKGSVMMLGLPLLVIEIGEGFAVIGAIILTVVLIRGALALERRRLNGEFV